MSGLKDLIERKLTFLVRDSLVDAYFQGRRVFFILSLGRSGTKFLASLLNEDKDALVVHEPVRGDFDAYRRAYRDSKDALAYIRSFRKKEMYLRLRRKDIHTYGEVNGVLRRHCLSIRKAIPDSIVIHLVRDGRDVVRSMMPRNVLTPRDPVTRDIFPGRESPFRKEWAEASRFEKLCWYWRSENRYLRVNAVKTVQFEKLIGSYKYFSKELLYPLGLRVPKDTWLSRVKNPQNRTRNHAIPHWARWDKDMTERFWRICGIEMENNGYSL